MSDLLKEYPDRFNKDLPWRKILFRPDKKSQAAELQEIQSVINFSQQSAFSFLYGSYSITKPIKIQIVSNEISSYKILLNKGQIYIETEYGGFFIDTKEQTLDIPKKNRNYIGINPIFSILKSEDNLELRDPLTGGSFCGDVGSDRLILNYELSVNQDSYPIALIDIKEGENPLIYYYTHKGYSNNIQENIIAPFIKDYIATRWLEESGDFIVEGLEVFLSTSQSVQITSGSCYIKGNLVVLQSPHSVSLSLVRERKDSEKYIITLSIYGKVDTTLTSGKVEISNNTLLLGVIYPDLLRKQYITVSSLQRVTLNSDIQLIKDYNKKNELELLNLILDKETVEKSNNKGLYTSSIFTDSFVNLSRSDVNHPLYSSSIIPESGIIRAGIKSLSLDYNNIDNVSTNNIQIISKGNKPYYVTSVLIEKLLLNQNRVSGWITVQPKASSKAIINLSPSVGVPSVISKNFNNISLTSLINQSIIEKIDTNEFKTQVNYTLLSKTVSLEAYGFKPFEDNIKLTFGNVDITELTLLNNTNKGSIGSSIKAKADGSVYVEFKIPSNLPHKDYVISLSGETKGHYLFKSLNPLSNNNTDINFSQYQYSTSSFAQTFTCNSTLMITGIDLCFRKIPLSLNGDYVLGIVSLTSTVAGFPSNEVLTQGYIRASDVRTSENGSLFTRIVFDKPGIIDKTGQYAIVFSPTVQSGIEIYKATVGQTDLQGTSSVSGIQPLVGGELVLNNNGSWVKQTDSDLTFRLIYGLPNFNTSELIFSLTNPLEQFNDVLTTIDAIVPVGCILNKYYKANNLDWVPLNNKIKNFSTDTLLIKLEFKNTVSLSPILKLDSLSFITQSTLYDSSWISVTTNVDIPYTNVEVSFQYYLPQGSEIFVFFSSNETQTWEKLLLQGQFNSSTSLVDGNNQIYSGTFASYNLSPTVSSLDIQGKNRSISRDKITFRVDFKLKDLNINSVPFIKRFAASFY